MGGSARRRWWVTVFGIAMVLHAAGALARPISCLGRIEPFNGVYQLAGPSDLSVVADLRVVEGQVVRRGEVVATLDTYDIRRAELERVEADLAHARTVLGRERDLEASAHSSAARLEEAGRDVRVLEADVAAAQAQLARAQVRAPIDGQVLAIHSRAGERIGTMGLLELGQTSRMYVVAEVYETDVRLIEIGQKATISSSALDAPLTGQVERVGRIIGKSDVLDLDPVARTDSRVVEVFILLDDAEPVSSLTNLQVDVEIGD